MIVRGQGAKLIDERGRELVDLCAGYGSVWLGHNHPAVNRALAGQLETYAAPGYLPVEAQEAARRAFAPFLPAGYFLGGIYSTGMEAVETALRAAWAHTGRSAIAGVAGSTHGRSFLTSAIGSGLPDPLRPFVHSLPNFEVLPPIAARLDLAAIVVEPVQMTGGAQELPREVCARLLEVASERGSLVIFDETLTGLYRCGARYYADLMGVSPDILILGKGLANGFPASAVLLRDGIAWDRERVRPGSTYWNHPLACAAIAATLSELAAPGVEAKVRRIERVIRAQLGGLELRGRGAMWCLGSTSGKRQHAFAQAILERGVVVSYYDRYLRLLPPLGIDPDELARACKAIAAAHADTFG